MKKLLISLILVIGLIGQANAGGRAILSWTAPTTNADGTPLTDLAGYNIHYGSAPRTYTKVINVGNVLTFTVEPLVDGTYYFAVTAYDTSGNESDYSNEESKKIDTIAPAPPTGLMAVIQRIVAFILRLFGFA